MVKGKVRDGRKEQQWRRWIREWRGSGLTVRAFCEERDLAEASFYAWRRTLEERRAERAAFLPVQVLAEDQPAAVGALEVVVRGARTVRVAAGFDAATLRRLLAVLEEQPC